MKPLRGEPCDDARGGARGPPARPGRPPPPAPVNTAADRRARIQVARATTCAGPGAVHDRAAARGSYLASTRRPVPRPAAEAIRGRSRRAARGQRVRSGRPYRGRCCSDLPGRPGGLPILASIPLRGKPLPQPASYYPLIFAEAARAPQGTAATHTGSKYFPKHIAKSRYLDKFSYHNASIHAVNLAHDKSS